MRDYEEYGNLFLLGLAIVATYFITLYFKKEIEEDKTKK